MKTDFGSNDCGSDVNINIITFPVEIARNFTCMAFKLDVCFPISDFDSI